MEHTEVTPNIEQHDRLELGDLVRFIQKAKNIENYSDAERLIPGIYFEGCHVCDDDTSEWCKELVAHMKANKIDAVEIYQDC